jgi:hypothetical protein
MPQPNKPVPKPASNKVKETDEQRRTRLTDEMLIEEKIGVFSELLKSGTDIQQMRKRFDDMREGITKLTEGCVGATDTDIRIWNLLCLHIDRAIPLFVRSNERKERWKNREGFVPPYAEDHIRKVNDAIHAGWIAPLRTVAHYLYITYRRTKYKDVTDLEYKKAEVGAAEYARIIEEQGQPKPTGELSG